MRPQSLPVGLSRACRRPACPRNSGIGSPVWPTGASSDCLTRLSPAPRIPGTSSSGATPFDGTASHPTEFGVSKLMWNQTPLPLQRAAGLPDSSGDDLRSAIRDVIGPDLVSIHVYRPDVVSQAVSFWRAVQTRVSRARPTPLGMAASGTAGSPTSSCGVRNRTGECGLRPGKRRFPRDWRAFHDVTNPGFGFYSSIAHAARWPDCRVAVSQHRRLAEALSYGPTLTILGDAAKERSADATVRGIPCPASDFNRACGAAS